MNDGGQIATQEQPSRETNPDSWRREGESIVQSNALATPPQTNGHELSDRARGEGSIRKVLVATDFSPASVKAVELATAVATQCDATLTILHVIDISAQAVSAHSGVAAEVMKALWAKGFANMAQIAGSLPGRVQAQSAIQEGLPCEEIVDKSVDFDLLVLGSQGRKGGKLFSNHTAQRVIETSGCPVLIAGQND